MNSIQEIKEKIDVLKKLDSNFTIFGASSHKYELLPTLSLKEIENFEAQYEIQLPIDYKAFVSQIGNGGAGPFYGILPLKRKLEAFEPENSFGDLKKDFKYSKAWNWKDKIFQKFDELFEDEDEEVEDFFQRIYSNNYYHEKHNEGSLYICDYGCALRFYLVVSGKEKGNIWFDQRADRGGISPVLNGKKEHVTFSDWYLNWLDESIKLMKNEH